MLARFGLGFKIPMKPLIIQILVVLLFLYLTMPAKAHPYTLYEIEELNPPLTGSNMFYPNEHGSPPQAWGFNETSIYAPLPEYISNNGSLKVVIDAGLSQDQFEVTNTFDNGTWTYGYDWNMFFWLRIYSMEGSSYGQTCMLGFKYSTPTWYILFAPRYINASHWKIGVMSSDTVFKAQEGFGYEASPYGFAINTWYVFWVNHNSTGNYVDVYWSTNAEDWTLELDNKISPRDFSPKEWKILHQEGQGSWGLYYDDLRVTDGAMYPPPPPPPPPFSVVGQYTWAGFLLGGIILMVFSPTWVAWGIKKKGLVAETIERMGYAMLLFIMGLGLFIMFLYS